MVKMFIKYIITNLAHAKARIFVGNTIGPECQFHLTSDIRYSIFKGCNYTGKKSQVHACSIGEFSYIGDNCRLINVEIGKFTAIGSSVQTAFGRHPYNFISQHPATYSIDGDTPTLASEQIFINNHKYISDKFFVSIGHDVWIGDGAKIFDGVKVGNGAVIGTNALVTRDVPPYGIVVGMPAKVVKYRFSNPEINILQKIEWWNWERTFLKNAIQQKIFQKTIFELNNYKNLNFK